MLLFLFLFLRLILIQFQISPLFLSSCKMHLRTLNDHKAYYECFPNASISRLLPRAFYEMGFLVLGHHSLCINPQKTLFTFSKPPFSFESQSFLSWQSLSTLISLWSLSFQSRSLQISWTVPSDALHCLTFPILANGTGETFLFIVCSLF